MPAVHEGSRGASVVSHTKFSPRTLVLTASGGDNRRAVELVTLLALLAVIAAAVALGIVVRRPAGDGGAALRESVGAQLQAAQQGAQGQVELLARSVADLRSDLSRALGATEQ